MGQSHRLFGAIEAFTWTAASGMVGLGGGRGVADGVSGDGSVAVGNNKAFSGPTTARLWTGPDQVLSLGAGGATDASSDGSVVVGRIGVDDSFIWTAETGYSAFEPMPSVTSSAWGVSGDGNTIVGTVKPHGFTASVSSDGSVVIGQSQTAGDGEKAFIWREGVGMMRLDTLLLDLGLDIAGWQLDRATGVSADGQTIVGFGQNPSGNTEAWMAFVRTPEPATAFLLACGLAGLAAHRRRLH